VKLLHLATKEPGRLLPPEFRSALAEFGPLEIVTHAGEFPESERIERIRNCEVLLTGWGSCPVPAALAEEPGRLRYICHLTGSLAGSVPEAIIRSPIPVTNWGDAPANGVAEAAVTLLLAGLKNLHWHIHAKERGEWLPPPPVHACSGTLERLRLGIYGAGSIGLRFIELCRPFGPRMRLFDPYLPEPPPGVERVADLESLFEGSDAIVIHAALTPETRNSVTAALLARLPDGAVIVNTARGDIIDQPALFAELERGRLRAALDVLAESDFLPPDAPARHWPNLLLTGHKAANGEWRPRPEDAHLLSSAQWAAIENLRRFRDGEPLRFRMDPERFARST